MVTSLYSLRVDSERIVAVEVSDGTAAVLLDGGRAVLLASEADLAELARRHDKFLWIIARRPPRPEPTRDSRSYTAAAPRGPAVAATSAVCEVA
jgi:hypothetical protein